MTKFVSKKDLQAKNDRVYREVEVPEWGGVVKVQNLTVREFSMSGDMARVPDGETTKIDTMKLQLATVVLGCVEPKFEITDMPWLEGKNSGPVNRLFNTIYQLSGQIPDKAAADIKAGGGDAPFVTPPESGSGIPSIS